MNLSRQEDCGTNSRAKSASMKATKSRSFRDAIDLRRNPSKLTFQGHENSGEKARGNSTEVTIKRSNSDPEIKNWKAKVVGLSSQGKDKKIQRHIHGKKSSHKGKPDSKSEKRKEKLHNLSCKEHINLTTKGEPSGKNGDGENEENNNAPIVLGVIDDLERKANNLVLRTEQGREDISENFYEGNSMGEETRQLHETKQTDVFNSDVLNNMEKFRQDNQLIEDNNIKKQNLDDSLIDGKRQNVCSKSLNENAYEHTSSNNLVLLEIGEENTEDKKLRPRSPRDVNGKHRLERDKYYEHPGQEKKANGTTAKARLSSESTEQSLNMRPSTPRRPATTHGALHEQLFDLNHPSPRLIHETLEDRPLSKLQIPSPGVHRRLFTDTSTIRSLPSSPDLQSKRRSMPACAAGVIEEALRRTNSASAPNSPPVTGFHYPIALDSGHRNIYTDLPTMPRHLARRALKRMGYKDELEGDGKSLSEKFEELKSCRYLRVPCNDEITKDDGNHMKI